MVIAGFEAAVLFPLVMIFRQRKLPPARLLLYAANPLLLVFISGEGHLDGMMVFFLCLGLMLLFRGREGTGFFCIGCAAMIKYFAWAAVPFLITRANWKRCWLAFLPAAAFVFFHDAGMRTFHSLFVFGTGMHYNDAITAMMRLALGDAALPVCTLILAAVLAAVFLFEHNRLRSLFFAFGWLLLFLPTLHPWYLSLAAPFAALFASPRVDISAGGYGIYIPCAGRGIYHRRISGNSLAEAD